jgi:predicted oxidoreductase
MWQVSGSHGAIDEGRAVDEMFSYFDAGLTTFDMADIYGPAEEIFGRFLRQLETERGIHARDQIKGKKIYRSYVKCHADAHIGKYFILAHRKREELYLHIWRF